MQGKIYTRKGDEGFTAMLCGKRVRKDDAVIIANGKIDSLQTALDSARFVCKDKKLETMADWIQEKLWQTGGEVSFGRVGGPVKNPVEEVDLDKLEALTDGLSEGREFKRFIRFHSQEAIAFNECRVRCREAEIALMPLVEGKAIRPVVFKFFNRLSSFFYAAACYFENGK